MGEFKDRIIKLLNDGKNISVELPNDIFIKDLLVELEDNKSHVVGITDSSVYIIELTGHQPICEKFRYFKMVTSMDKESHYCSQSLDTQNEFLPNMNIHVKEIECRIFCKPKVLTLTPLNNEPINNEILDTIKDYLGSDMLSFEEFQTINGRFVYLLYNSYEVDEREV